MPLSLESAGHPPVAPVDAVSGRWSPVDADGPALGLPPGAEYDVVTGRPDRGDALLLCTGGLLLPRVAPGEGDDRGLVMGWRES